MSKGKFAKRSLSVLWIFSTQILLVVWRSRHSSAVSVTVATYNIWNVMFQWDVRKVHIADMIRKFQPDVVGFQEVRGDLTGETNQLLELQLLLPNYKHHFYHVATKVSPPLGFDGPPGWQYEGLGMLSRHPIVKRRVVNLNLDPSGNTDSNKRIVLHAQLEISVKEKLNVTLVHLSYDKKQQCRNAADIIDFISSFVSSCSVIMGDFNAYNDFQWPVKTIMEGASLQGDCHVFASQAKSVGYGFVDALASVKHSESDPGFTFSNMPQPGLVSRPDRILVSKGGLKVESIQLLGDGSDYKRKYSLWNKLSRLNTVLAMAQASSSNQQSFSYTCHHDCGPHGSCRCGVCVSGPDNSCSLLSCSECDLSHYNNYLAFRLVVFLYISFVLYLITKITIRKYFLREKRASRPLLVFFPNRLLIALLIASALSLSVFAAVTFGDSLQTVNNRLPEEMFPSDHLLLLARLKFTEHR